MARHSRKHGLRSGARFSTMPRFRPPVGGLFAERTMRLDAIPIGKNPPEDVNVVIEVPIGGEPIKYEMDKASGALVVDRFLYTAMRYPGNYGFIPHTLSDDGDPCDVLVANTRAIAPGAIMNCRVVGVLIMEDEAGQDEKIVAVPSNKLTPRYAAVQDYTDLGLQNLKQIEHFFEHYKDLEPNKWVRVVRWGDSNEAKKLILEGIKRYNADKEAADAAQGDAIRAAEKEKAAAKKRAAAPAKAAKKPAKAPAKSGGRK
jgi:inorganic pyrophosphatase